MSNKVVIVQLLFYATIVQGNAPYFDGEFATLSVLFLPKDTKIGTVIYRFQASDSDGDYPLDFRVESQQGSDIAKMENVDKLSANLILSKTLQEGRIYNMTIAVVDTSRQETKLFIRVNATNALSTPDKVFIDYNSTIIIPEDTRVNSTIGYVLARKHLKFQRFVTLELKGTPKFQIKSVLEEGNEITRGNIILTEPLDYENEQFYELTIIAQNVYEEVPLDNRNIMYLPIYVQVSDVQDSPPIFTQIPSLVRIPTNLNPGERVFAVKAIDGDQRNSQRIKYSLEQGKSSQYLEIDENEGHVMLIQSARQFSRESKGLPIVVAIKAEEISNNEIPGSSTTKEVVIIFEMVINEPPRFSQETYQGSIPEHQPAFSILQLQGNTLVSDPEQGPMSVFTLSLQDGDQNVDINHIFEILPPVIVGEGRFEIRVKSPQLLDYENLQEITFQIVAKDVLSENALSSTATVNVQIQDINDNSPKFHKDLYDSSILEDAPIGTFVAQVSALDKDKGDNGAIKYTKLVGNMSEKFSLDIKTGRITVASNEGFDREEITEIHLTVEASDGGTMPRTNTTKLRIRFLDVNDNAPTFKQSMYESVLTSDYSHQGPFLKLEAEDIDEKGTNNSNVRYEIYSGNVNNAFQIDSKTGEMRLNKDFAALTESSDINNDNTVYYLQVRAYDLGVPHKSKDALVKVYIKTDPGYMNATVQYIFPATQEEINRNRQNIEGMLMKFTGSHTTIQSVASYDETYGIPRDTRSDSRSLVTTVVRHPKHSRVDISSVLRDLNASTLMISESSQEIQYGQASVGWKIALIILLVLLAVVLLILLGLCLRKYCPDKDNVQKTRIEDDSFAPDKSKLIEVATVDKMMKEEKDNERRQAWDIEKQKAQTSRVVTETTVASEDARRVNFIEPRRPASAGPAPRSENGAPTHPGMMYSRHLRRTDIPQRSGGGAMHHPSQGNNVAYHTHPESRRVNSSLGIGSFSEARDDGDQIEEIIIYEPGNDRYNNSIPRRTIKRVIKRRFDDGSSDHPRTNYNNFVPKYTQMYTEGVDQHHEVADYEEVYPSGSVGGIGRRYIDRDPSVPERYHVRNDPYVPGRVDEGDLWATRSRYRRVERGPSNRTKLSSIGSEGDEDGVEGSEFYNSPDGHSVLSQRSSRKLTVDHPIRPGAGARNAYNDPTDSESDIPPEDSFRDQDTDNLIKRRPHRGRQRIRRDAQLGPDTPNVMQETPQATVGHQNLLIVSQGSQEGEHTVNPVSIGTVSAVPVNEPKNISLDSTVQTTGQTSDISFTPPSAPPPSSNPRSQSRASVASRKPSKSKGESRYMNWYKTSGKTTPKPANHSAAARSEHVSQQPKSLPTQPPPPAQPKPTPQPPVKNGVRSPNESGTIPDETIQLQRQNINSTPTVTAGPTIGQQQPPAGTQEDDDDSGIGHGDSFKSSRKQFLEKRSLFTIAYNGMNSRQDALQDVDNS